MKLNKIIAEGKKNTGKVIPTGIQRLDNIIKGLHIGHVHTLGARPVMGKTAFVATLVRNIGLFYKVPLAVLSLEQTEQLMAERIWAAEFGWDNNGLPDNPLQIESGMEPELKSAIARLRAVGFDDPLRRKIEYQRMMNEAPVWIEHDYFLSMDEVISRMERQRKTNNVRLIIIDGLDYIDVGTKMLEQAQSMLKLVQAAERLQVAVLLTSGLNRDVENRVGHRPMLANLRGGFCAEAYSSMVMFIFRPEYYGIEEDVYGSTAGMAEFTIAKNSLGSIGHIILNFAGKARFEDAEQPTPFLSSYEIVPSRMNNDKYDILEGPDIPF